MGVARVYKWEILKLLAQKRTYLGLGASILVPIVFVVVLIVKKGGANDIPLGRYLRETGLATPFVVLFFMSIWAFPLITALVAGDIVANEDSNGTLKTILTRSVDRGQVFAAKALAAITYATIAVFLAAAVATAAGVASWGFNSITTFNLCYLIPLLTVTSIGVLLSTVTRNSAASVVGTVGVVILLFIVAQIPGLEGIHPYLLTEQFENWHGLLRTPTDWAPIWHSLWVCALYAVPSLAAAYLVFLRRDVAGG
jgi:ABC-2 type transport system permease protein